MALNDRCYRVLYLLPILIGRLLIIAACSAMLFMAAQVVIVHMFSADGANSYAVSIVWSSIALGAVAEQKLESAIYIEKLIMPSVHVRTVRRSQEGPWFHIGIWAQASSVHRLFMHIDVDSSGHVNLWNQCWTVHIIAKELYGWSDAVVHLGHGGVRMWSSYVVEVHYWLPTDRYTSQPQQEFGVLEIRGWRKGAVLSFMAHCKAFTMGSREPLLTVRAASQTAMSLGGLLDDSFADEMEADVAPDAQRDSDSESGRSVHLGIGVV